MSSQSVPAEGSAPASAQVTLDSGDGHQVLVSVEDAVATLTSALEDGQVVSFPLADGATLLVNGAQVASVVVSRARSGAPKEKHIGM